MLKHFHFHVIFQNMLKKIIFCVDSYLSYTVKPLEYVHCVHASVFCFRIRLCELPTVVMSTTPFSGEQRDNWSNMRLPITINRVWIFRSSFKYWRTRGSAPPAYFTVCCSTAWLALTASCWRWWAWDWCTRWGGRPSSVRAPSRRWAVGRGPGPPAPCWSSSARSTSSRCARTGRSPGYPANEDI